MTLLQAAEKLHVDPKVLESLEAERFEALGAPVYVRGHLKRYADLVGEQSAQLLETYASITKPSLPDLTQLPKAQRGTDPRKLVLPALVVLIAFALVGSVWWVLQNLDTSAFGTPAAPPVVNRAPEGQPRLLTDEPVVLSGGQTPPAPASVPSAGSIGTAEGAVSGPASSAAPATAESRSAVPAQGVPGQRMDVRLEFSADSWVEVYDAAGERLFFGTGSAESSRTLTGTPPLRVVLGNAPGVSLDVNGKPADVPANLVRNHVAQFLIDRSGRIVRVPRQTAAAAAGAPDGG